MKHKLQVIILIGILVFSLFFVSNKNGFTGMYDISTPGIFPNSVDKAILNNYPLINKNKTSNNNYSDIWWKYPIFKLGSYKQITNNLKYNYNPDDGTCIRADFCGAIYHNNINIKSNIITELPPVEEGLGARVGYFRTNPNELYFSIPTNENILY